MKTLDARLVIGGLWRGAEIHAEHIISGHVIDDAVYLGIDNDGDEAFASSSEGVIDRPSGDEWRWSLSLRLPGPLGLGLAGLEVQIERRTNLDLAAAIAARQTWVGASAHSVSRYIAMADALAALHGWPTGPGAPVYEWGMDTRPSTWCLTGGPREADYHRDVTQSDPMVALEAVWLRECAQ